MAVTQKRSRMTAASDGDTHTFASLPASLQSAVLQRVTEDASQFCRLSLVCRAWRDLVWGQPWTHLKTLTLHGAGGLSPIALAPDVENLYVCHYAGLASAELAVMQSLPLQQLRLEGMAALSPEALLALASPQLTELRVVDCSLDVARLAALLSQCPALSTLCVTNAPLRRVSACGAFVEELEAAGLRLKQLNLAGSCEWLDTTILGAVASSCARLELLDVGGARDVTAFPPELLCLPHLRILRARQAGLQGDHVAAVIGATPDGVPLLPSLQQLDVSGCYRLRSRGLQSLANALDRESELPLTHLNLCEILDLGDADAMAFLSAAKRRSQQWPQGLALTVASCGRLGKAFVAALCDGGFTLDEFNVSGLSLLDADALIALAEAGVLSNSRVVDLSHCQHLAPTTNVTGHNARAADAIASAVCCAGTSLTRLVLDGCCVTDATILRIAEACTQLADVSLVGCAVSSLGFTSLGEHCTRVESLSLGGMKCVPDADSLAAFHALRTLRLHRYRGMAADTLASVARGCRHLRTLSLAACGNVTDDALLLLAREAPQLRVLTLQAEDHTELCGSTLHHLGGLRCLTLRQCPNISDGGVLRLLARNDQVAQLALPLKLHLCMSQRVPVRVQPALPETGLAHWRPPPALRMELT